MITTFRILTAAAIALASCNAGATSSQDTDNTATLHGQWQSIACELRPQAGADGVQSWYLKRSISFTKGRIDAHFTNYADSTCQTPVLELKFGGDVKVNGASDIAPGALSVDLIVNDYLTLTPRAQGIADYLNSDSECGDSGAWQPGQEQDVYQSGCSAMGVKPASPTTEYEVLYVNGGRMFFGARPVDGMPLSDPQQRPGALQIPLTLVSGNQTRKVGAGDFRVPQTVEIVTFEQQQSADLAEVRAFFEEVTQRMNQNDTLLYRSVAQGENGTWLCVNYWTNLSDMKELNQQAASWKQIFAQMATLAKPDSFRLTSYQLQ
jgi:hypothetical protein